jgi:F0F1-type ATP synthase membrane subunit b/b'
MKKSIFSLAFTAFAAGTILTSCNSSAEKVEKAKDNVEVAKEDLDQAKEDYNEEYAKFKLESEQEVTANDVRIAELKADINKVKKDVKVQYEATIASLEQKNEEMKTKMRDYKESGNENWQSFKREFNHDMDELGQALKDITKNNSK